MSLSLDRMRFRVRMGLKKLEDPTFINEDIDELLNLALWEISDRFDFHAKENLLSSALVEGQSDYSISDADLGLTLDSLRSVAVIDSDNARHKLARTTRDWLDVNQSTDEDNRGFPTRYLREGNILILDPCPGADEDALVLEISVQQGIADLAENDNETTGLPRNWDEMVVQGAISRGHFYDANYQPSAMVQNIQEGKMKQIESVLAKEAPDRYAGLQVLWDFPEQGGEDN